MLEQVPPAPTDSSGLARAWFPILCGGAVIGATVGYFGAMAAVFGLAGALGLVAGAWVLAIPARAVTLYAFLLPFDVYLSTSLRVTSTQVFQVLALALATLGVLTGIGTARRTAHVPPVVAALGVCLISYLILSLTWSINPEASARSLVRTVAAILLAGLGAAVVRDGAALRRVLSVAALGALVTSLYGYAQFVRGGHDPLYQYFSPFYSEPFAARGGGFSVVATFANPNILAGYGLIVLPLIWALAVDGRGARRAGWTAVAALVGGAVLLTFSKAGWLLVLLLASLWMLTRVTAGARLALAGGAGIALGVALMLLDRLVGTFSLVFPNAREMSVDSRLGLWRAALEAFVQSPLIGFGLDGFAAATAGVRTGTLADLIRAHNIYLQTLVDLGIVGSLLFFAPLVVIYVSGLKTLLRDPRPDRNPLHLGLVLSTTGVFVFGLVESLTVSNNYVNASWLVFGLLSASTMVHDRTLSPMGSHS